MLNFKNISPNADFYSKLDNIVMRLDFLQKNVLYTTHTVDKILKLIKALDSDEKLQKQVDEYFDEDETSPQTESDTKDIDQKQIMVLKTGFDERRPNLPSKRPFGTMYQAVKLGLKEFGYYDQIRQYDPGYYFDQLNQRTRWFSQSDINKWVEIQRTLDVIFPKKSSKTKIQFFKAYNSFNKERRGYCQCGCRKHKFATRSRYR